MADAPVNASAREVMAAAENPIYVGARQQLIGHLEITRAHVAELLSAVGDLTAATVIPTAAALGPIGALLDEIVGLLPQMDAALAQSNQLYRNAAEPIDRLRHSIEKARASADPIDGSSRPSSVPVMRVAAQNTSVSLTAAQRAIRDLLLAYQLKTQLHGLRVGQSVDFAAAFASELPTVDERVALLTEYSRNSRYFDEAVFDSPDQRVWRKSGSAVIRALTCLAVPVFAVLLGGVLAAVSPLPLGKWQLDDTGDLLAAYGLVLAGVLANLVVENIKQSQSQSVPIIAIGATIDWLHLRWAGLLWSFAPVLIVVIGLLMSGTKVDGDEALVFFFGGYSVDSVAGTFLTRFGTAANAGRAKVQAAVAGGS